MSKLTISGVVRAILTDNINLTADQVIAKARTKGLKASDESVRGAVYNIKGELKKAGAKAAPAAARETALPKSPAPAVVPAPAVATDLDAVLANVALVNAVVGASGGVESARRVAEAVRACGGVDAFLQHLDLVAGIRAPESTN